MIPLLIVCIVCLKCASTYENCTVYVGKHNNQNKAIQHYTHHYDIIIQVNMA